MAKGRGSEASDEGKFALFRLHYDLLKPEQKRNVFALASALSKLWGDNGIEEFARRCQELGDTENASLDLTISVVNSHPDGRGTYSLDPTQLKAAIECWDQGKDYLPQAKLERPPGL